MRWTARIAGIAMCPVPTTLEQRRESGSGTKHAFEAALVHDRFFRKQMGWMAPAPGIAMCQSVVSIKKHEQRSHPL